MKDQTGPPWGTAIPGNRWDLLDGRLPDTDPLVSVIIVHFQQQRELDRTLLALQRQSYPVEKLELIVVDDGSAHAPSVPPGVTLLVQPDQGFRASAARNLGAAAASGDILCFLDADTVPEPSYVARLTRLPSLTPEAVTVGRRLHADLDGAAPIARIETIGPERALADPQWLRDGYQATADLLTADDRSYRYIISAVMACSRWFFNQVGGFDESFQEYGGEDWEWAYRAWIAGAVFAHVPQAVAWHHGPDFSSRDMADSEKRRRQQQEAMRLAEFIPVPGSRGRGLRWFHPDILVTLKKSDSAVAGLICVDSMLTDLPGAVVMVPEAVAKLCPADERVVAHPDAADLDRLPGLDHRLSRVRIRVELMRPVRVGGSALPDLLTRLTQEALHHITVLDSNGTIALKIHNVRADRRSDRWNSPDLFSCETSQVDEIETVDAAPNLAAYFGGWR